MSLYSLITGSCSLSVSDLNSEADRGQATTGDVILCIANASLLLGHPTKLYSILVLLAKPSNVLIDHFCHMISHCELTNCLFC